MNLVRVPASLESELGNLTGMTMSLTWRALKPPLACCQLCCPDCCCCWLKVIFLPSPFPLWWWEKKISAMHAFASELRCRFHRISGKSGKLMERWGEAGGSTSDSSATPQGPSNPTTTTSMSKINKKGAEVIPPTLIGKSYLCLNYILIL